MLLLAFQKIEHAFHKVVDIQQFKFSSLSFTVNGSSFATAQQNVETAELYLGLEWPIRFGNL